MRKTSFVSWLLTLALFLSIPLQGVATAGFLDKLKKAVGDAAKGIGEKKVKKLVVNAKNIEEIIKRAEAGESYYQTLYAYALDYGVAVPKDVKASFQWYKKAMEQKEPLAISEVALSYAVGTGVPKDEAKAVELMASALESIEKIAEAGDVQAQCRLGYIYLKAQAGVQEDKKKGYKWIRIAANKGQPVCINYLGWMYEKGKGVEKSRVKAFTNYRKSATRGYMVGATNTGISYKNGYGVKKDYKKAKKYFLEASKLNDSRANYFLGGMHEKGLGFKKSDDEAIKWYQAAAIGGHEKGQKALGRLMKKKFGINTGFVPITNEKLPKPPEFKTASLRDIPEYKVRYRTLVSSETLKKLDFYQNGLNAMSLRIDSSGKRILIGNRTDRDKGQTVKLMLLDLETMNGQVADVTAFKGIRGHGNFWLDGNVVLNGDVGNKIILMNVPKSDNGSGWNVSKVFSLPDIDANGIFDRDKGRSFSWQRADIDAESGAYIRTATNRKHGEEFPLIFPWNKEKSSFEKHSRSLDFYGKGYFTDAERKLYERYNENSGLDVAGYSFADNSLYYMFNNLKGQMNPWRDKMKVRISKDDYIEEISKLTIHIKRMVKKGNGYGAADRIGRVNLSYYNAHYLSVTRDGRYALTNGIGYTNIIDLKSASANHELKVGSIYSFFTAELKTFENALFDPNNSRRIIAVSGRKDEASIVEVILPEDFDDYLFLTGSFFFFSSSNDSIQEARGQQGRSSLESLSAFIESKQGLKGVNGWLGTLLGKRNLWEGHDNLKMKTISKWEKLPTLDKGLKVRLKAKRAELLYKIGFKDEALALFRSAIALDSKTLWENGEYFYMDSYDRLAYLDGGMPLTLTGELLLKTLSDMLATDKVYARLGVDSGPVSMEQAKKAGLDKPVGAYMKSVDAGDPAAIGGMKAGDVILSINGKPVADDAGLTKVLKTFPAYSNLTVEVARSGGRKTLKFKSGIRSINGGHIADLLIDYSLFATAAGHPALALQGVARLRELVKNKKTSLSKTGEDMLVAIEALVVAAQGRHADAYKKMVMYGSFHKYVTFMITANRGRARLFAPLYNDRKKLSFVLGIDADKLPGEVKAYPPPQPYPTIRGKLITPPPAPRLASKPKPPKASATPSAPVSRSKAASPKPKDDVLVLE